MGRRECLQVGDHLGVVVVVRVARRELVGRRPRGDPVALQGERPRLRLRAVQLDVIGPGRLADVVPRADELRALLARVDAVDDVPLDRARVLLSRRDGHSGRHQEQG